MRDFILILAAIACTVAGMALAYWERGYFAVGMECLFAFIPACVAYIRKRPV